MKLVTTENRAQELCEQEYKLLVIIIKYFWFHAGLTVWY